MQLLSTFVGFSQRFVGRNVEDFLKVYELVNNTATRRILVDIHLASHTVVP